MLDRHFPKSLCPANKKVQDQKTECTLHQQATHATCNPYQQMRKHRHISHFLKVESVPQTCCIYKMINCRNGDKNDNY